MARTRINRGLSISPKLNERVIKCMEETGLGFSSFMQTCITTYLDQRDALGAMNNLGPLLEKIEEMNKREESKNGVD